MATAPKSVCVVLWKAEKRADGWPLCPQCGEDELYSMSVPATIETICGCYRCGPAHVDLERPAWLDYKVVETLAPDNGNFAAAVQESQRRFLSRPRLLCQYCDEVRAVVGLFMGNAKQRVSLCHGHRLMHASSFHEVERPAEVTDAEWRVYLSRAGVA